MKTIDHLHVFGSMTMLWDRRICFGSLIVLALATGGTALFGGQNVQSANSPAEASVPASNRLPISLPVAFHLAQANPLEVQLAAERINAAQAQWERARVLWLPNLVWGIDYARHDGRIQDIVGNVLTTSRSSFMAGAGPNLILNPADAVYARLIAQQNLSARRSDQQAVGQSVMLAVAERYFAIQQARGELSAAVELSHLSNDLVQRTEKLTGLIQPVEVNRSKTERARRRQAVETAQEHWQTESAELARLLRLPPTVQIEPVEAPQLLVQILQPTQSMDELVTLALQQRPELASQQALVQAALARLKQEKLRPLIPSVLLRGNATNPAGTLSTGLFGGGVNDDLKNFGGRNSMDLAVLWEFQNLGLGNRAAVRERTVENRIAVLELFRLQDRIAAEVVQAHTQSEHARNRYTLAEEEVKNAVETVSKSLEGLSQTRRVGDVLVLLFRPQEAVAALQALDQAYRDFYQTIADVNRAQFRLYHALGHPAAALAEQVKQGASNPPVAQPAPLPSR
jgi:outer membrane protein TolC